MEIITEHFLIYQFVYIFFLISLIFIISAMFIRSKRLKLTCLVIFAVFIAMGLSEWVLLSQKKDIKLPMEFPEDIFSAESKTLHQQRQIHVTNANEQKRKYDNRPPNNDETVIYDSICTIYPNRFRYTKCNLNSDENYIFLGCSFVFGDGLNDDQTLPYYFSKLMNFEKNILNCGIPGRSSNSATSILESDIINHFVNQDSQTKYIIYFLIDDHINRNFRITSCQSEPKDNWVYENSKWERVRQPFGQIKLIFAGSYIFNKIFSDIIDKYNEKYYENYMIESLEYLREITETKYKSKFIVAVCPGFRYGPMFISKLKKTNLDIISLPNSFNTAEYQIKGDGHPNAKANKELANVLMNYINKKENKN